MEKGCRHLQPCHSGEEWVCKRKEVSRETGCTELAALRKLGGSLLQRAEGEALSVQRMLWNFTQYILQSLAKGEVYGIWY